MKRQNLIYRLKCCIFLIFCFVLVTFGKSEDSTITVTVTPPPPPKMHAARDLPATESVEFWLTTELLSADFRKGCLSTALCHEPKFKLINTMVINGEQAVISWPVNGASDLVQEQARSFVTHWTLGEPEDIALSCQIAGTDPSFGFSRVCDETPSKRVFNEAAIQRSLNGALHWRDEEMSQSTGRIQRAARHAADASKAGANTTGGRMIVELRGRCFNATLAIRKHTKRCPWCPDLNTHIVVSGQQSSDKDEASGLQQKLSVTDAIFLHYLLLIALSGAIVFGVTGFCCAVFIHCRYRKQRFRKGINAVTSISGAKQGAKRLLKFAPLPSEQKKDLIQQQPQQQCIVPVGSSTTVSPQQFRKIIETVATNGDMRYEMPWEQRYRQLPVQWMVPGAPNGSNASHYQTLTWARQRNNNNNNNNDAMLNNNNNGQTIANYYGYSAEPVTCCEGAGGHQGHTQHQIQQTSSSSIGACSGGSSGDGSAASTSATTIGCSSLGGGSMGCPGALGSGSGGGAIVSISPVVNHSGAMFAALKQQQQQEVTDHCETIGRTATLPYGYNNSHVAPHTNPYAYQQYYLSGPPPPVAAPPPRPHAMRSDDGALDSV